MLVAHAYMVVPLSHFIQPFSLENPVRDVPDERFPSTFNTVCTSLNIFACKCLTLLGWVF